MTENKKRGPGRPKGSKNKTTKKKVTKKKTQKKVDQPEQPQRDEKGRWMPGQSGNKGGTTSEHQRLVKEIRQMSVELLHSKGFDKITKALDNAEISVKELVMIVKFLADCGLPKELEPEAPSQTNIPTIVISDSMLEEARKRDAEHLDDEDENE